MRRENIARRVSAITHGASGRDLFRHHAANSVGEGGGSQKSERGSSALAFKGEGMDGTRVARKREAAG